MQGRARLEREFLDAEAMVGQCATGQRVCVLGRTPR
jgi:hypothetical protein